MDSSWVQDQGNDAWNQKRGDKDYPSRMESSGINESQLWRRRDFSGQLFLNPKPRIYEEDQ